ncbi:hypothetical protein RHODO2019_10865 [Rhodococcus antarcticus]|uniref:Scaffolding protein n=1 Tax=Rhodococcus antarcticus TaxID=2987751 RepID=A0ABY6NWD8_9NOCA|nr:hypothetical protein [Rhodococcus antarcticus]UZJ23709.1 hypothetical protein RHODO2019_10865 [Rhodococcus antarcticus]
MILKLIDTDQSLIDSIFARRRALHGDLRMEDPGTPVVDPAVPAVEPVEGDPKEDPAEPVEDEPKVKPEDELPDWAKSELTKVRGEAANYRTRLREVEKKLTEAKTPEEHAAALQEFQDKNATLERSLIVNSVARKHDLPDALAARLNGSTEAELEADAKELAKLLAPTAPADLRGGLDPDDEDTDSSDPRAMAKRYGGRRR